MTLAAFMVERYLPGIDERSLRQAAARTADAAAAMSSEGKPVSYLGSTFVPGEEACFCRFAAGNVETVKQVNELAGFPFWRIVGAQFVEVHHPNEEEQA